MTEAWAAFEARLAAMAEDETVCGRRIVPGEGCRLQPPVCLIGEAPGGQEEAQGRPFVGKAGQNLNEFLDAVGLLREDIWITNVVKVRPSRVSPKGTISNRPPNRMELKLFLPLLHEELALVRPRLAVTLGNTALQALLGPEALIGACHGRLTRCSLLGGPELPLFPLYHPASIIYNPALKAVYAADLGLLREALDRLENENAVCS